MAKVTNQSNFNAIALGQHGAVCVRGTDSVTPPRGMVFCAITALDALTFSKMNSLQQVQGLNKHSLITGTGGTSKLQINGTTVGPHVTFSSSTSDISPGDIAYTLNTDNFLAVVKSVGVASDGSEDDNVIEFDRQAGYASGALLGFRTKDRGYIGAADRMSSATIPKGVTIYGAWTCLQSAGSDFIAYLAPSEEYQDLL